MQIIDELEVNRRGPYGGGIGLGAGGKKPPKPHKSTGISRGYNRQEVPRMAETRAWVTRSDHHPCTEHTSHWRLAAHWVDKTKIGYLRSCSERFPSAVSFTGTMDMALALRTMVVPTARTDTVRAPRGPAQGRKACSARSIARARADALFTVSSYSDWRRGGGGITVLVAGVSPWRSTVLYVLFMYPDPPPLAQVYSYDGEKSRKEWVIHLQAGAGVVADSVPEVRGRTCPYP